MPEPTSHQALRQQNLALVLATALRLGGATRREIELECGLSKATVSRLVDELLRVGALEVRPVEPVGTAGPGPRPGAVRAASSLGAGLGLSIAVRDTTACVDDLAGQRLVRVRTATPHWSGLDEAVDWTATVVSDLLGEVPGPLRRAVVALPGRARGGRDVASLPLFLSVIEGSQFAVRLEDRLGCPVRIELDASMILSGLEALGVVERGSLPVLFNLGSVLTMALRRADGSTAEGRTPAFGDFDLLPVRTAIGTMRVGHLLGAHGLFEAARALGHELTAMEALWQEDGPVIERLRAAFVDGLEHALRTVLVMADPGLVVVTGRMSPLVEQSLDRVLAAMAEEVAEPPRVQVVTRTDDDPAAVGAAAEATGRAVDELVASVVRAGADALR